MIRLVEPPATIRWTDQFYESSLGVKDPDEVKDLRWREEYHFVMSQSLMELALRRGVPCNKGLLLTRISAAVGEVYDSTGCPSQRAGL